ncbi:MAG: class I SAM-dependent methyltransferase [Nitrospiria bacterium]
MALERHDFREKECLGYDASAYLEEYCAWILPNVRGRVLDIGGGMGYLSKRYSEKSVVESVIYTDRYYDELESQTGEKLRLIVMSTEKLIETNDWGKFDTITCTEHIEHLPESIHKKLLVWIKNHLAENGLFLGSMPNIENSGNPYHLKEYLQRDWEKILKEYFSSVDSKGLSRMQVWKCKI